MTAIPKFVVTAGPDGLNALMDIDIDGDLDTHPLAGLTGTFTPNLVPAIYPVGDWQGTSAYLIEPINFIVDSDGKFNGTKGVELLANSVVGVGRLQWCISFDRFTFNGERLEISPWWFDARQDGETVELQNLMSVNRRGSSWLGVGPVGPKLASASILIEGKYLRFVNSDDASFLVHIPNGATALVDKGDGTWDVAG